MRGKSEKTDEELETKIGAVMCVHVDANRTLSQLSYRPKKILKYLSADYHNTLFSICEPPFSFFC